MKVLGKLSNQDGVWQGGYMFFCPGCKCGHLIHDAAHRNGVSPGWTFNGSDEKPTFSPSYLVGNPDEKGTRFAVRRCHSFIKDGMIQFLDDCFHELRGKTVSMVDMESW